jgi:hypothetical protein
LDGVFLFQITLDVGQWGWGEWRRVEGVPLDVEETTLLTLALFKARVRKKTAKLWVIKFKTQPP